MTANHLKQKIFFGLVFVLLGVTCRERSTVTPEVVTPPSGIDLSGNIYYSVRANASTHSFTVNMFADDLTADNAIYQFAATQPGIYQVANFGQYVTKFNAYDKQNQAISVDRWSVNQWKLAEPGRVYTIQYEISDTFHHQVATGSSLTSGSSIEADVLAFTPPAVIGYLIGAETRPHYVHLEVPDNWKIATTLTNNDQKNLAAYSYGDLADAPFLAGPNLSVSITQIQQSYFSMFVYSHNKTDASQLSAIAQPFWEAAMPFLNEFTPASYSAYVYIDDNAGSGGLEHRNSSFFTLSENALLGSISLLSKSRFGHEYFHHITPKGLHSDIIENFNFATPTPSAHLWWYEGVTCWATAIMPLRSNKISLMDFYTILNSHGGLGETSTVSLIQVGLDCYKNNFGWLSAYSRGGTVAMLLDIRLLELSGGTKGLREIVLELYSRYNSQPFKDEQFIDIITQATYPEIGDFLKRYVIGTEPLPVSEYLEKIGLDRSFKKLPNLTDSQQALFAKWSVNL